MYKFLLCAKCGSRCNLGAITTLHNHLCSLMIMQPAMVTWYVPQMGLNFIGLMGIKSSYKYIFNNFIHLHPPNCTCNGLQKNIRHSKKVDEKSGKGLLTQDASISQCTP